MELMENKMKEWNFGPSLEYAICHMAIVSFENFAIMLGGKTNQEDQIKDIYKFDCISTCQWTKLNQVLMKGQKYPIVYPIIDTNQYQFKNLLESTHKPKIGGRNGNVTFKMAYLSEKMVLTKMKETEISRCALHCACK